MERVYCIDCIHLKHNMENSLGWSDRYSCKKEIENLSERIKCDSWLVSGSYKHIQIKKDRRPFEINVDNDCEWFTKKQNIIIRCLKFFRELASKKKRT